MYSITTQPIRAYWHHILSRFFNNLSWKYIHLRLMCFSLLKRGSVIFCTQTRCLLNCHRYYLPIELFGWNFNCLKVHVSFSPLCQRNQSHYLMTDIAYERDGQQQLTSKNTYHEVTCNIWTNYFVCIKPTRSFFSRKILIV